MSSESWVGCLVHIDCGEIGHFQGRVSSVNGKEGHVCLQSATLDGEFLPCGEVTIKTGEIKNLKILSVEPGDLKVDSKESQVHDSQKERVVSSKKIPLAKKLSTSDQKKSSGSNTKVKGLKKRTQECFSIQLDDVMIPNFDFEKNLKLFDKEALFDKLKAKHWSPAPRGKAVEKQLNYDENVLEAEPVSMRQIVAPVEHTGCVYHTDDGVIVPAISMELKNKLIKMSETMGLTTAQRDENAGMCTCQMAVQLLGGKNRFTQRNAHQPPHVIVMVGSNSVGIHAICAARHLANHKVHVTLFVPIKTEELVPHLALFYHTGCKIISNIAELPTEPVDLVIHALVGHDEESANEMSKIMPVTRWANNNKAPILIIDPCSRVRMFGVEPRWSLAFALPLIDVPNNCRMYLADIGIPKGVFTAVNIKYTSPFGDKFVIALNE